MPDLHFAAHCCGIDFTERAAFDAHTKVLTGHQTPLSGWRGFQATKPLRKPVAPARTAIEKDWLGAWVEVAGQVGQVWSQSWRAKCVDVVVTGPEGNRVLTTEVKNLKPAVQPAVEADLFAVAA